MSEKMGLCAAYRNVSCGLASRLNPSYDRPLRPFPAALLSLEDSLRAPASTPRHTQHRSSDRIAGSLRHEPAAKNIGSARGTP